jgi:hypothetical protein
MNAPTIKLTWKVAEAPSGRFRSFHKRGWPSAVFNGTSTPAASIDCEDSYTPKFAASGSHRELTVRVADHSPPKSVEDAAWKWRTLKGRFATLDEAKAAATRVLNEHPEFHPREYPKLVLGQVVKVNGVAGVVTELQGHRVRVVDGEYTQDEIIGWITPPDHGFSFRPGRFVHISEVVA